eukprot:722488-Prorocentrum_minimum.AAC.2
MCTPSRTLCTGSSRPQIVWNERTIASATVLASATPPRIEPDNAEAPKPLIRPPRAQISTVDALQMVCHR